VMFLSVQADLKFTSVGLARDRLEQLTARSQPVLVLLVKREEQELKVLVLVEEGNHEMEE